MKVGLSSKPHRQGMVSKPGMLGAGAELTLGCVVMGARLLRGCHGERADACSWWSWHGQQDDHKVRWMRCLTPEGTTDCQLPFFLLTGCKHGLLG